MEIEIELGELEVTSVETRVACAEAQLEKQFIGQLQVQNYQIVDITIAEYAPLEYICTIVHSFAFRNIVLKHIISE